MANPAVKVALIEPVELHADGTGAAAMQQLQDEHPHVDFQRAPYGAQIGHDAAKSAHSAIAAADAILCLDLPPDIVTLAPQLRWVQSVSAGIERLPLPELRAAGITMTNASGAAAPEIAEFVFARILEDHKRLGELAVAAGQGQWLPRYGTGLSGTTIGLVGFGAINQRVARLAEAFDMRVLVGRRSTGVPPPGISGVYALDRLDEMLPHCEVLVVAVPETPQTTGLLGRGQLSSLPHGALLINVGRGSVLDEAALMDAAKASRLRAALDVLSVEPPDQSHPLWRTPGIRISAHCASVPTESTRRTVDLFSDNLRRLARTERLHNEQ